MKPSARVLFTAAGVLMALAVAFVVFVLYTIKGLS